MKLDKVLLATIIVFVVLIVVLATHLSTQNTFIGAPPQTTSSYQMTLVYDNTTNTSMWYPIMANPASVGNAEAYDSFIIDHGNGNVTVLIPATIGRSYPKGTSMVYDFFNASVFYSVFPTKNFSSGILGPPIVRHILITDDISSDNRNLSIKITPQPDGSGLVNITARAPEGTYSINGTIQNSLNLQPGPINMVGIGYLVDNDTIQYQNQSLKLKIINARNETFYVSDKELY